MSEEQNKPSMTTAVGSQEPPTTAMPVNSPSASVSPMSQTPTVASAPIQNQVVDASAASELDSEFTPPQPSPYEASLKPSTTYPVGKSNIIARYRRNTKWFVLAIVVLMLFLGAVGYSLMGKTNKPTTVDETEAKNLNVPSAASGRTDYTLTINGQLKVTDQTTLNILEVTGASSFGGLLTADSIQTNQLSVAGRLLVAGDLQAGNISGNGSGITGVDAAALNGLTLDEILALINETVESEVAQTVTEMLEGQNYARLDADNIFTGNNIFSNNVTFNGVNTYTAAQIFNGTTAFNDSMTVQGNISGESAAFAGSVSAQQFTQDGHFVCDSSGNCLVGGGGSIEDIAFVQGGNNFGVTSVLGNQDNYDLTFITNNTTRLTITQSGDVIVAGALTANTFSGNGGGLNNLNASNLGSGTVPDARLSTNIALRDQPNTFSGVNNFLNVANTFAGDGAGLTNVDAALLGGQSSSFFRNAANLNAGTLDDLRLSSNVTLQGNTFNGNSELVQLNASGALPALDGSNLSNVNAALLQGYAASYFTDASNLSEGTLDDARLSSNVPLKNADNVFTGANNTFAGLSATSILQNGNAVCDMSGNCPSSGGGGGIAGSGTTGFFPVFSSASSLTDSIISQASTTITVAGTLNAVALQGDGSMITDIDAANITAGIVSVERGGTGVGTFAANGLLYGNGTGAIQVTNAGATGQCLVGSTGGAPMWMNCVEAADGSNPGGAAGGDLGGTYPNPVVTGLNGTALAVSLLAADDFLLFDGVNWVNMGVSGDITITGGVATIGDGVVTNIKLANSALSVNAGTGLTGGGSIDLGGSATLSVVYGATAGTAVEGNTTLICPAGTGNLTGGGDTITLGAGGTCTNLDVIATPAFTSLTLANALSLGDGGTGATTAAGARTNLGAAASGSNNDITSLNAVTSVGGNGVLTLQGNASTTINASDNGFTTSVGFASPTANISYLFADAVAGTYEICTSIGNCAGAGGGVTDDGGTVNTIAMFTGTGTIGNSLLSQSGTTVTVAGTLVATALQGSGADVTNLNGTNIDSGTVGVSVGGTGVGSFTSNGIIFGNGTGALQVTVAGTTGECLVGATGSSPTWMNCALAAAGATPGGAAGGDLGGSYPSPTVVGIYGTPLSVNSLTAGDIFVFDGTNWINAAVSGDITVDGAGVATIANGAVTNAKLANSAVTVSAGSGLTGGGSVSLGATTTLNVAFGSTSGTSVAGNTTLICTAGTGNLIGGGNTITLGDGGTCGTLSVSDDPSFNSLTLANALSVANGGTGATSASAARTNLGAAASGANSDITSLNGLTTALSAGQGGTGVDGSAAANGQLLIGNGSGYTLANIAQGSGISITNGAGSISIAVDSTVCTTAGNCSGVNGGVTTSGGTVGAIPVFTAGQVIEDSIMTQSGSVITVAGTLAATSLQGDGSLITGLNASNLASGTVASARISGSYSGITAVGILTGGSIGTGFGTISTTNAISTTAALQGNTLSIGSGAFTVDAAGAITAASGISSSGAIVFSSLNAAGIVRTDSNGELSTSAVILGTDTSGSYVANLGTLTGLTTTGNSGAGATPTLSVTYGSGTNTAAEGSTLLSFSGTGNLTGSVNGTAGGGFTSNTLNVVSNPTFSGLVTANGGLNASNVAFSGSLTQTGNGTITLGSLGEGIMQTDANGVVTSGTLDRNSANLTGETSVANGGTGATTASGARSNLGAAARGANSDITSLGGLTTALSAGQGGTGVDGSTAANGTLLIGNGSGYTLANLTQGSGISITNGTGSITIEVDNTVCTTAGNCNAVAGAVSTSGGTTGTIALFTGTQTIGDSILSQSGSVISVAGTLTATALQGDGSGITGLNASNLASGTVASARISGSYSGITAVGALTGGSIGTGFGTIATTNDISTSAALQGNTLSIGSGAFAVNASGAITTATGISSSGAIVFSSLNTVGVVKTDSNGELSTSAVILGTETSGSFVANLGSLSGLTTTGNSGAGSTPTLGVIYGATPLTAAQGNTALSFTGTGNLTGTVSGTSGGGFTTNTLTVVSSPTFSGLVTANGGLTATDVTFSGNLTQNGTGTITFGSLGAGIVQTDSSGEVSSSTLSRNSSLLTGQTSVANGGTGATTAAGARTNLGAAASGANSDITSLGAVTSVGGSGALTLQGNASTVLNATDGGFTTSVGFAAPTANITYLFADAVAGTYDICTTSGNCAGVGGSITGTGTTDTIAMFTGTGTIGNSLLSQSGTTVTVAGTLSATALQGSGASITNLNGTNITSGTVGISVGGTGRTSFTADGIVFGNGTGALGVTAAGVSGDCLVANTGGAPTWANCSVSGGGGTPGGAAGGDLSGTYPNPQVVGLYGTPLTLSTLTAGDILVFDGNDWINAAVSGDISVDGAGVATIANGAVSNAKLANSGVTVTAGTGLGGGGGVTLGGIISLNVVYGATSTTAVRGDTTLVCSAGIGNLGGGGNTITLGAGGTCNDLTVSDDPAFNSLTLTTALSIANGGTGATSAGGARTNLGAAKNGANTDITSLSGLTTALSAGQGGTGVNGGSAANGSLLIGNGSGYTLANLTQGSGISITNGSGSITIEVDNTVCTTAGNCNAVAGAVSTSGGTTGTIALFTGTQTIGDSILSQSGSVISVAGTLSATTLQGAGSGITNLNASNLASGTVATGRISGSYTGITGVGALTAGSIGTGFGAITTTNNISTSAALQGNTLSIGSGTFAVNSTGAITSASGITSSGTIVLSSLNSVGVVKTDANGQLSTGSVILGTETTGGYVANLGTLVGLTTTGNSGAGSTPGLSVTYGAASNTAAQGSTTLSFNGAGNLTGGVSGTAGGGFGINTLNVVSNPTFSGLVTANGGLTASNVSASGTVTFTSFGSGIVQSDGAGELSSGTLSRNSSLLTGQTSVANGGTGATTSAGARTNLGAAASGSNSDITSLNGLTAALSAGQGGTGVNGGSAANGSLLIGNGSGYSLANLTQGSGISITNGSGSITIEVDNTVCTTAGNCSAVAGAVTTSGGTTNTIAMFTGTQTVGDSILTQSGTVISVAGTLSATTLQGAGSGITNLNASNLASGTVANGRLSGSYTGVTGVGALTAGSIGSGFGSISTANNISTSALLQGNTLSIASGAFAVNSTGAITAATGLTSSGAINFSSLNAVGVVKTDSSGNLSTSAVILGVDTSGSFVANLGSLTGLTTTGNSGAGSTPTLSVTYGAAANTAAQGNTVISFNGAGNLTGNVSGTSGGGIGINTLAIVNNPTFSGLVTANGGLAATTVTASSTVTFSSLGAGIVQTDGSGVVSSNSLSRNSTLLTGQTSVANGGTGATTAAGARTNLGAAASGANSDITSLSSVTSLSNSGGALTVGNTGQALTLQGNASTVISATANGFVTSVGFVSPTANVNYRFATAAAGTYNICTTAGNCSAVAGGVTTAGGTTNTIAMFTGSQTVGNSILSQSGATVTVAGTLAATTLQGSGASITNLNGTNIASGTVGVSVGGTGRGTFTTNGVIYGNGTSGLNVTVAGVSGQCLVGNTGGAPSWVSCATASTGANPGGAAGGDLSGSYPNPTVVGLYGTALSITSLTNGNIMTYNGTNWVNASSISLSGNAAFGGTLAVTGSTTLTTLGTSGAVTFGSTLAVTGAATFGGTLTATGNITTGGLLIEKSVTFTPTAVGWYRIATNGGYIGGTVKINAAYDNTRTDVEFDYSMGAYGTDGSIQQTRYSSYNSGVISQVRVSSDGGANAYLDVYISTATSPGPISIYGYGPNMPSLVSSPVVGAAAGSTNVRTLATGHGFRTTNGASFAQTSGSVGIGTASPNWKLDVQGGDLNVSGNVLTGGTTRITSTGLLQNVTYNGNTIGLSYGGTGATTAAGARTNLGAAASGANSDITSITGLTTALSVGLGGTGINGFSAANGRLLIGNGSGYTLANLTQGTGISISNGSGSITIGVDNTVCTTGGNCSGVGGGVTTPGGTTNRIAMFTGAQTLGDSVLSQSGTTITVNGSLSVTGATTLASVGVTGAANVGSLTVTGNATIGSQNMISLTRTLPTVVNQEVDLGTFALTNGGGSLLVSVTVPSSAFSAAKQYIIPISYAATSGTWQVVQPISDSGPYAANNFALDINVNAANASLRLRRIAGTNAGTAYVTIVKQGVASDVFTPSTSTASVAAPTVTYGAANLTQVGGNTSTTGTLTASSTAASVFGNGSTGQIQIGDGTLNKAAGSGFNFNSSVTASTFVNATTTLQTAGTTRIDASGVLQNVTYNGNAIGIGYGGTGSTTAAGARVNLGAAASGSNSDITTLNALTSINNTGSLSIGNTGQTMLLQGNASTTLRATSGSFTTTVGFATPTANVTYRFVGAAAGTYDICTTGGNCAGVGGGVTTPGGTANTIAMFTGTGTIANSVLSQSGTTINIGGSLATGGTVRLDNSGNLSNIGNLTYSGTLATTAISGIVPFEIRGNGFFIAQPPYLRIGSNSVYATASRGLTLTIVNRSNYSVVSTTTYDTYANATASNNLATALNGITTTQIGVLTSADAWEAGVTPNLQTAFMRLGLSKAHSQSQSGGNNTPYAAIFTASGNSGVATTNSNEVMYSNSANAPAADIRGWFVDGDFAANGSIANALATPTGTSFSVYTGANGNVGIGTTATGSYKLTVAGSANATTLYQNGNQVCDTSNNCGYSTGSGGAGYIQNGTTPQSANYNITGTAVIGSTLTVGNEIIGTSTTLNQFRAIGGSYGTMFRQDGSNFYLMMTNSGNQYGTWNSLRPLTINNASGTVTLANGALVAQQSNGRVGIGTTSPSERLDVDGNINTSGNIMTNGVTRLDSAGNLTVGTVKQNNTYPVYKVQLGGGTDYAWKTIANVTANTGLYTAASFEVNVTDANCNFGCSSNMAAYKFYVSIHRSSGAQDDAVNATISGPVTDYIRVVKTSNGTYELQARVFTAYRHVNFTAEVMSQLNTAISYVNSPVNGSTTGTIYTPQVVHNDYATNLVASGTVQGTRLISTVATGTAPLQVNSSTLVTNLNADLLDGLNSSAFALASGSGSYIQNGTSVQTANFNINGNGTIGGALTSSTAAIGGRLTVNSSGYLVINDAGSAAGAVLLQVGDDSFFTDVDTANTVGLYGVQNSAIGALRLGSGGPTLYGAGGSLGIGTTTPGQSLDVQGGNINTSGSLMTGGTARLSSAGVLNNITGINMTSGNFAQAGAGTFSTGAGANTLNGATSVTSTLSVTGAATFGSTLTVDGDLVTSSIRHAGGTYNGTDITGGTTRTLYFEIPGIGNPPRYHKIARVKITGNYNTAHLSGYLATGFHVGSERRAQFDFTAYSATNPASPAITYSKYGLGTDRVLVTVIPNGGGAGTNYYDIYMHTGHVTNNYGQLDIRVSNGAAVTVWQSGLDTGTTAPTDTLISPSANYSFDTSGNVGIGTTSPSSALHVNGTVTATLFSGSGASLTALNATQLTTGTVPIARLSGSYTGITGTGALNAGTITSGFGTIDTGDTISGSRLIATQATGTAPLTVASTTLVTSLNADMLDGFHASSFAASSGSASYIHNGTSPQSANFNITGNGVIGGTLNVTGVITGNGSGLTALNATQLTTGTVPIARLSGSYTGITGTGALNAGTITSGFGAIDVGGDAITTTAALNGGNLNITGAGAIGTTLNVSGNTTIGGSLTVAGVLNSYNLGIAYHNDHLMNGQEAQDLDLTWATVASTTTGSFGSYIITWNNRMGQTSYMLHVSKAYAAGFSISMNKLSGTQDAGFDTITNTATNLQIRLKLNIPFGTHQSNYASFTAVKVEEVPGRQPSWTPVNRVSGWVAPNLPDQYLGSGNVGIGTTNPGAYKLNVQGGNVNFSGDLSVGGTITGNGSGLTGTGSSFTAGYVTDGMYLTSAQYVTGVKYFQSNKGASSYSGANNGYALQAFSSDGGSAAMSFHRGSAYAVNMGLDPDNVLRIGGWSAGANRWQLDMAGNQTIAGNFSGVSGTFSGNVNVSTGVYQLAGTTAIEQASGFLRINQSSQFSNGIWLGDSVLRAGYGDVYLGSVGGDGQIALLSNGGDTTRRITLDGSNGNISIAGNLTTAGNAFLNGGVDYSGNVTAQKERNVSTVSVPAAGWYRVATISGAAGRGQNTVTVYTTGGSYVPRSSTIRWWHDYSTMAGMSVISESDSAYWSQARVTDDGTNSYLEINFTQAMTGSGLQLSMQYDGGHIGGTLYSGSLPAGGGNVRSTMALGVNFNLGGDKLAVATNGNVGIGTGSPGYKLDVQGTAGFLSSLSGNGKSIFSTGDAWLRINPTNAFTNGIYTGTSLFRTDGELQVGSSGSAFRVTSAGAVSLASTLNVGGNTTASGEVDVTGGSGTGYTTAPIEIRTTATPRIGFHWPGVVASQLGMDNSGIIRTFDNPGTGYAVFAAQSFRVQGTEVIDSSRNIINAGNGSFNGSVTANGGLIQDGFTVLNGTDTWLRTNAATGWYSNSYGGGIYMTDSTYVRTYNSKPIAAQGFYDQDNLAYYVDPASGSNLAGNVVVTGNLQGSQLISTVGTGTAPLTVSSTTKVANLNADWLDGYDASAFVLDIVNANPINRLDSGFYENSSATTANGWPLTTNSWMHLMTSTHSNGSNNYSMQLAASFYNSSDLFYRSTAGSGSTAWSRIWHSSNDGVSSGLDADLLDGMSSASFAAASGSGSYINNTTSPQSANFNITGAGTVGGNMMVGGIVTVQSGSVQIGGAATTGFYTDGNNMAIRGYANSFGTPYGLYVQNASGSSTTLYVGQSGTYGGNVGIGTTTPGYRLQVVGIGHFDSLITYGFLAGGGSDIRLQAATPSGIDTGDIIFQGGNSSEYGRIYASSNGALHLSGSANTSSDLQVTEGAVNVNGNLAATGNITASGALYGNSASIVASGAGAAVTLAVNGRIRTGDANNYGGVWLGTGATFVGQYDANSGHLFDDGVSSLIWNNGAVATTVLTYAQNGFGANLTNTAGGGNGVCHDGAAASGATGTTRNFTACSTYGADVAEFYPTDGSVEAADIVAITPNFLTYEGKGLDAETGQQKATGTQRVSILKKAAIGDNAIGFISTAPQVIFGREIPESAHRMPLALTGRIPVKVNDEGGPIQAGDLISLSTVPGVATKAYVKGKTLGVALEDFNGTTGTINVYVQDGYYQPPIIQLLQATDLEITGSADIANLNVSGDTTLTTLTVSGSATFLGTLEVKGLLKVADIEVNGHIITAGDAPVVALNGAFDTDNVIVDVVGNDTSGTITITANGGALFSDPNWASNVDMTNGVSLASISFNKQFSAKPRIMLSSANSNAARMGAFTGGEANDKFEIYANNLPANHSTYTFTYWATQ